MLYFFLDNVIVHPFIISESSKLMITLQLGFFFVSNTHMSLVATRTVLYIYVKFCLRIKIPFNFVKETYRFI